MGAVAAPGRGVPDHGVRCSRQARAFFEAPIADNLDLGRPEHVELLFKRDPRGRKPKDQAGGVFKTAIDRNNQGVTINAFWRHSRVKQYLNYLQP